MAERYKPVPHETKPWEERFDFEARKRLGKPFGHGRKGTPVKESERKPPGLQQKVPKGKWKYVPGR